MDSLGLREYAETEVLLSLGSSITVLPLEDSGGHCPGRGPRKGITAGGWRLEDQKTLMSRLRLLGESMVEGESSLI